MAPAVRVYCAVYFPSPAMASPWVPSSQAVAGVLAPNWLKSMVTLVTALVLASPLAELSHTAVTVSPTL
ncbi:hypothetical protein D3C79_936960 [compost metagenome]